MRSCSQSWRRRSTITGSSGLSVTCSRPGTSKNGNTTKRSAEPRKAAWLSPVLSNIYLHKLDEFVERELIPRYTRGRRRTEPRIPPAEDPQDERQAAREPGPGPGTAEADARPAPQDPADPGYRRLRYIRYADDHLLGFTGPKAEAEEIKEELATFLRETLRLELNQDKTLITHARTQRARFLGYDITVQHGNTKLTGQAAARVPLGQREDRAARAAGRDQGQVRPLPAARQTVAPGRLQNLDDYDIVRIYGAEYRGIVNYYLLAQNVSDCGTLRWNAETSMLKTLAAKHHSTVRKMAARYKAKIETSDGKRTCFEAPGHARAGRT